MYIHHRTSIFPCCCVIDNNFVCIINFFFEIFIRIRTLLLAVLLLHVQRYIPKILQVRRVSKLLLGFRHETVSHDYYK